MPEVTPTKRFDKAVCALAAEDAEQALDAVSKFVVNPKHPGLNFEKVVGTTAHHTIRTNNGNRICLRKTAKGKYDLVDVGTHDYIYKKYG